MLTTTELSILEEKSNELNKKVYSCLVFCLFVFIFFHVLLSTLAQENTAAI